MWYLIGLAAGIVLVTLALVIRDQKRQAQNAALAATGAEVVEPAAGLWQNYPVKTTLALLVLLATGLVLFRAVIIEVPGTVTLFAGLANLGAWLALAAMRAYPPEEAEEGIVVDEGGYYEEDRESLAYSFAHPFEMTMYNMSCNEASPWYDGD